MITGFVTPTVRMLGPDGGKFMQALVQRARLPFFMTLSSWLAVVSGILLYWQVSGSLQPAWIASGRGIGFSLGSLAGIAAFLSGLFIQGRSAARMSAIAGEVQAAGGPPKPGQVAELLALQERIRHGGHIGSALLAVALALMAISQYLG
jgi:hypothetical protein